MRHFFLMICISKPSDTIFQNQEKSFVMSGERIYPKHHIHQINQFCQDFSHNIKKSRNSFEKWNPTIPYKISHKKWKHIVWDQWLQVANQDEKTNFRLIHHKITTSHLRPGFSEKMRGCPDDNFLTLMKQYQMSLIKGTKLVSTPKFLENTSKMIKFFPLSTACGQHVK